MQFALSVIVLVEGAGACAVRAGKHATSFDYHGESSFGVKVAFLLVLSSNFEYPN